MITHHLQQSWYDKSGLTLALRPLSWLFILISVTRRYLYSVGIKKATQLSVPTIIVGNLTVGGTGKTPLVIWLANYLKELGYKPGILSRGYGGMAHSWPQQVRPDADPYIVGDEAVVISRRTQCPMAVGPDRVAAGEALLKYSDCDIVISDDGLQHYPLKRNIEILVIDGIRRFGNGYCLPAGPLRECVSRKEEVDCKVTNGVAAQGEYAMSYTGLTIVNLITEETRPLSEIVEHSIKAVAGIGNPDRFFNFLRSHGLRLETKAFPDHYLFQEDSIVADDDTVVLMTEKDAVKCQRFAKPNWWYVPVNVTLPKEFGLEIINLLEKSHG
ncbi:Tetraacyldisaccharide 4'-kinase [hydrothermal vent metagenome]|uniref:tetraacyldisaccharide 4'-kinase n=1 Tax=hydrothermal vent metagenome TaxID=652676 RepID=A0A3B1AB13_9ZZZZ